MLISFIGLCIITFVVGYLLTAILYRHKSLVLKGSDIEIKIFTWIPIFIIVLIYTYTNPAIRLIVIALILWNVLKYELKNQVRSLKKLKSGYILVLLVCLGVILSTKIVSDDTNMFLTVWFMSVFSDVTAYFAGNFYGKNHLPKILNNKKSWEGVVGQLVGALIGYVCINVFVVSTPLYFVFTVGVGSALGDLSNSYVKRRLKINEWSHRIPGHGGYLDRLCSLSFSLIFTYGIWLLFNVV